MDPLMPRFPKILAFALLLLFAAVTHAQFQPNPSATAAATSPAPSRALPNTASQDTPTYPLDQPAAQSAPPPAVAEQPHLGERVNEWIDNLAATADRLIELPISLLLIGLGVPALGLALAIARIARRRPRLARNLIIADSFLLVLFLALLADRRIANLQDQLRDLKTRANATALTPSPAIVTSAPAQVAAHPVKPETAVPQKPAQPVALLDLEAARITLASAFSGISFKEQGEGTPLTFLQLQSTMPLVRGFISIVDMTTPGIKIKIGANLSTKTLTSTFARDNKCIVAINGEAGSSPQLYAPLGTWTGHLITDGKVILTEQPNNPRPFFSFDKTARLQFLSASLPTRAVPADAHNVIWGRWDVLNDSQIVTADFTRQPRTAIATNKDKTRLFLFVGDGRQPRYSIGFTRADVGNILRALGATDGMLCDEGGSSCMYLQSTDSGGGGIVNTPSDNQGRERPTYTHFGISIQ